MSEHSMILLIHAAETLYMTGLIWFVQIVHYPLFEHADREHFVGFEKDHQCRTSLVVIAPMVAELGTAVWLVWKMPGALTTLGLALLTIIWLSTFLFQVPAHNRLARGYDEKNRQKLVRTNWIRAIVWTLRPFS